MPEAMTMEDLRRGSEEIDLDHTLGDQGDIDEIREALDSDSLEAAKAVIIDVLRGLQAVSLGGFPIGAEIDLTVLVGFDGT